MVEALMIRSKISIHLLDLIEKKKKAVKMKEKREEKGGVCGKVKKIDLTSEILARKEKLKRENKQTCRWKKSSYDQKNQKRKEKETKRYLIRFR